ncbi:uncharacterized protein LOC141905553 [Tubulanus polymorphus]|uniref:uncharacterized protein LOC141905553 n=1 Tax=Tubulanus polymorphus TaxID=672921 RepID=UPI003DA49E2E
MTESLLMGKRFFCREWAFSKINHCLENRHTAKTCGALIMGGPGCGKTALCCELVSPTTTQSRQNSLRKRLLAYHFCQAHDIETLSICNFIHGIVDQLKLSSLIDGYAEKLDDPLVQAALEPRECELNPDEAFKKAVLLPLMSISPPPQTLFALVDSIDESYLQSFNERKTGSRTIAELLANHHPLFPQWLLIVCSARKQSKSVTRLFTGFRKISLDDLRKSHVVKDVQQYILCRLDQEEELRQHLSRDTAEMLNQLHIKSNGCFLYLEKVLDGVANNFIMLREIKEIPGTLNGLYLWLCQRLFIRKQFAKIHSMLNAVLAARRPLAIDELYRVAWTRNALLTRDEFRKRLTLMSKILIDGPNDTKILFHHSFAEWLLDVKHCTQKYLCNAAEGHGMLAMALTLSGSRLKPHEVQDLALHLSKSILQPPIYSYHYAYWMILAGVNVEDSLSLTMPREQRIRKLLLDAGARPPTEDSAQSNTTSGADKEDPLLGLLDDEGEIDAVDGNGRTLLANAAYQGNSELVVLLLARGADTEVTDKSGQTALNLAARQGHVEIVSKLLKSGACVDHTDADGWTALRSAAWGGHTEVVGLLLEAGAEVDHADSDQRTALRAAAWGGHDEIVRKLLTHGADVNKIDNEGRTALIAAAYMGHSEIVDHLLAHGANINHQDCDGRTALSVAALCIPASQGHSGVVSLLLDRGAEVDHRDKDGMTPLLVAAYEGHQEVCELLLENDADADHCDNQGRTPLLAAASMGHASVVNLLLIWGAAIDTIDSEGRTVLCIAAAQGNVDVVRHLLDRGLDEMHRDNGGLTPLHLAAFEGHREICEALMDCGAKVNEIDNEGRHALILAGQEGHLDVVMTLIEHAGQLEMRAHDGKNAFRAAAFEGHLEVVQCLICDGTDIDYKDADGRSTLYVLALENRIELAKFLLENGADIEGCDLEGRTPLHVASWQGHLDMVKMLLAHSAYVNAVDNDNRTSLQSASWQGHVDIVKTLLQHGADSNHTCNQGATALCIASQEGHEEVVRLLLQFNANPNHADEFGRTALRVAQKSGHNDVMKILEEYGASINATNGLNGHKSGSSSAGSSMEGKQSHASSAVLTNVTTLPNGHSLLTPSESPESTVDRRKSYVSNQSSSKSSSNLTSGSSTPNRSATVEARIIPHIPIPAVLPTSEQLSFTQQLQQCSKNKNRQSISRVLSPVSEPQSPVLSLPGSPLSEIQSVIATRLSPEHKQFTTTPNPSAKLVQPMMKKPADASQTSYATSNIHIIMNPNAELLSSNEDNCDGDADCAEPIWQLHPQLKAINAANMAKLELQRRENTDLLKLTTAGDILSSTTTDGGESAESPERDRNKKRNGIVTNPNFPVAVNGYMNKLANIPDNRPASKISHNVMKSKAVRPTGLAIKKETPL